MKYAAAFLLALFVFAGFPNSFAQSGRTNDDSDGNKKANKRPETPAPTPEPTEEDLGIIDDSDVITVETELVTIPVRVMDRKGRFLPGLTKENFEVFEDGKPQEIAYFNNESQPFTVALVLDMSYSSTFKIEEIQQAAIAFVAQLHPADKVMVVSFDETVNVLARPTSDRKELYRAIKTTRIGSGTSVYEAMNAVFKHFERVSGRKAVVLFSDGVDTTSRTVHDRDNLNTALELDALIYPIKYDTYADVQRINNGQVIVPPPGTTPGKTPNPTGLPFPFPNVVIGGGGNTRNDRTNDPTRDDRFPDPSAPRGIPSRTGTTAEDYRIAGEYLQGLADRTGGRLYEASSTGNLALAFSKIAEELREFYSLGYYPPEDSKDGKFHKIKVRVNQEKVAVKARDGYVAKKKEKKD